MRTSLLVLSLLVCCYSHPVDDSTTLTYEETTTEVDHHAINLQRDVNLVSYIQNFKQIMAQYVNAQYKNLTIAEIEKVKITLEEFLQNFATDLRETVENKNNDEIIETYDGLNDDAFAEIKRKIVIEFPEVTENVADKIIVKLRKNLYVTRNKLDNIIRESHKASFDNSQ